MKHKSKEREIFWELAVEQFKDPTCDMEKSRQACLTIAKRYNISEDRVYKILGKGWKLKWDVPEYPKHDFSVEGLTNEKQA